MLRRQDAEYHEFQDRRSAPGMRRRVALTTLILLLVTLFCLGHLVYRQYPDLTFYWSPISPKDMVDSVEPLYCEVKIGSYHVGLRWQ